MNMNKFYKTPKRHYTNFIFTFLFLTVSLFSCSSDQGRKFSRDPVIAGAFGKSQESAYTSLLQKYVDADHRVRYRDWKDAPSDISTLKNILTTMSQADEDAMGSKEKMSFYINAYNAMTLDLILSNYEKTLGSASSEYPSQRSIQNIDNLGTKVWDTFQWKISGRSVTLNEVENKILRPMGDARIHFAINCASKGCPPLLNRSFSADDLDLVLDQLSDNFINGGKSTSFDAAKKEISTSSILDWFGSDFVKSFGSIKGFISKYVKVVPLSQVLDSTIFFTDYDWLLNEPEIVSQPSDEITPPSPPQDGTGPGSGTEGPTPPGSGTEEPEHPGSGSETFVP